MGVLHRKLKGPTVKSYSLSLFQHYYPFHEYFIVIKLIRLKRNPQIFFSFVQLFFFFFFFHKDLLSHRFQGGRKEGRREIFTRERRIPDLLIAHAVNFLANTRDFVVREDLLRVACELDSTHTRYFYSLSRNPCTTISSSADFFHRFLSCCSRDIFEQLNNLFHGGRGGKKMIFS